MLETLTQKRWSRWLVYLFIGILVKFLLDVTFSLMFRNYTLLQPFVDYLYAMLLAILSLELVHQVREVVSRRISWDANPRKRFFVQWTLSVISALLVVFTVRWAWLTLINNFYYVRLLDEIIILSMVLIVITTILLVEVSLFLLNKWRFSLAELERFKKENAEFQFESLRSQVNPHFLFNSLNTLSSLVYESQEKAEAFIRELSDVYRYVLENRGKELVTLKEELAVARSYIYLLQLRFDTNLHIQLNIDEVFEAMRIAPLTLQLLIENAVKHNVVSRRMPLHVSISIADGYLLVKNTLQVKESNDYSTQLGLKNIQSRYAFLTDNKVEIVPTEREFIVKIPLIQPI